MHSSACMPRYLLSFLLARGHAFFSANAELLALYAAAPDAAAMIQVQNQWLSGGRVGLKERRSGQAGRHVYVGDVHTGCCP